MAKFTNLILSMLLVLLSTACSKTKITQTNYKKLKYIRLNKNYYCWKHICVAEVHFFEKFKDGVFEKITDEIQKQEIKIFLTGQLTITNIVFDCSSLKAQPYQITTHKIKNNQGVLAWPAFAFPHWKEKLKYPTRILQKKDKLYPIFKNVCAHKNKHQADFEKPKELNQLTTPTSGWMAMQNKKNKYEYSKKDTWKYFDQ